MNKRRLIEYLMNLRVDDDADVIFTDSKDQSAIYTMQDIVEIKIKKHPETGKEIVLLCGGDFEDLGGLQLNIKEFIEKTGV